MKSFMVGRATKIITPSVGCELAGFAARGGTATRVHDDLFASVLVISAADSTVAFVSLDVIGVTMAFSDSIRDAVHRSRGIKAENIFVCATHTHCGPVTLNHFFNPDQELNGEFLAVTQARTVAAIEEAFDRREESTVRAGMVAVDGVAVNRRNNNGKPVDEEAGVLLVEDAQGNVTSILVNYACHPTVLGPDTLEISKDFPHYWGQTLRQQLGEDVTVLFFNGAEGDLNIGHKSALTAVGASSASRTFAKAQEIGESLAVQVIAGLPSLEIESGVISCETAKIALPLKQYPPLATMRRILEEAEGSLQQAEKAELPGIQLSATVLHRRCDVLYAGIENFYASLHAQEQRTDLPIEVGAVRIGNTAVIAIPGEPFVEIGLAIRKASPYPRTFVFGLANDYIGYIPTSAEAKVGGYEVVAAQVEPFASTLIEEAAQTLLDRLHLPAFAAGGEADEHRR